MAISHTDEVLDHMNEWSQEHHDASGACPVCAAQCQGRPIGHTGLFAGLTERCRSSTVSMQQAEEQVRLCVMR